jgi:hypothetical protein
MVVREHDPQAEDVALGNAGMPDAKALLREFRRLADDLQETLLAASRMSATRSSSRRLTGRPTPRE